MHLILIFIVALVLSFFFLGIVRTLGLFIAIVGFAVLTSAPIVSIVLIPLGLIVFVFGKRRSK